MLFEVAKRNLNAQDSEILYRKIVRLLQKKSTQRGLRDLKDGTNRYFDDIPLESEHQIKKHAKLQKYAKIYTEYGLDFGVREVLLKIMKDFRAEFLN